MTDDANTGSTPISMLIGAPVVRVAPDADLWAVCEVLADAGIGSLVVGDGDDVSGIVTERDVVGALAEKRDRSATRAGDVAKTTLVWCDADAPVADVAAEMTEQYVRHVLVEEGGRLVGVVSARDLLGTYAAADLESE
jgi:CBS domain-containing protein